MKSRRHAALALLVGAGLAAAALGLARRDPAPSPAEPTRPVARGPRPRAIDDGISLVGPGPRDGSAPLGVAEPAARPERARAEARGVVLDPTDRPVRGAQVRLAAVDPGALRGVPTPDGADLALALTEDDGSFALPAPTTGLARLTAWAAGYARAAAWVDPAGARLALRLLPEARLALEVVDADGAAVPQAEVELAAERLLLVVPAPGGRAEVGGLPEGAVRVRATSPGRGVGEAGPMDLRSGARREVVLVLTRAARVAGEVLDAATGSGIAGAEVRFARPGRAVAADPSDARGAFAAVLAGAAGESLWVSVTAEGYAARLEPLTLGATDDGADRLRFVLERAEAWSGRVEDATGSPVGGARVAYTADGVAGRAPAFTRTDAEGRFTLPPPPPPAPGRRVVLTAAAPEGRAALALRPGDPCPEPLVLRLVRGVPVRGRVTDERGGPRAGVLARLQPAWDRIPDRGDADLLLAVNAERAGGLTALTADDGGWVVEGVPPGTWRLALEREGTRRAVGEPFAVADAAVDRGAATWGAGPGLRGRVTTRAGLPVPGAGVRAFGEDGEPRAAATASGPDGGYALTDLGGGPLWLEARAGAHGVVRTRVDPATSAVQDLVLPEAAPLTLEVTAAGRPYAGVLALTLEREPGTPVQRLGLRMEAGTAEVEGLPAGTWRLVLEAPGGLGAAAALRSVEGRRTTLAVPLVPGARLAGRVRRADGGPVGRGRVHVRAEDGGRARTAAIGTEGEWHLDGLAAGAYRATAEGEGGAPAPARVVVEAGAATPLTIELAPAGGARVRVLDAEGRAVAGARIAVRAREGQPLAEDPPPVRTGRDGRARLADLPTGALLVVARTADGREGSAAAQVRAREDTEVEVRLGAPAAR